MKKLFVLFCCLPLFGMAQNFHFAGRLGISSYQGDLKAKKISLSQPKLMGSIGAKYDFSEHITARSYLSLGGLRADDKKGNAAMQQRNLNFRSKLLEWELSGQYSFFSLNDRWWSPYVFAGIGFFHFKPYTENEAGDKTFLKPLSTEGQGFLPGSEEYKLTQLCLPLGAGAQYALGEDVRIGLEVGYRKTFTDYIDDVSDVYVDQSALLSARGQEAVNLAWRGDEVGSGPYPPAGTSRGNAGSKDGYYYVALTLSVRYWFDKYKQISGLPSGRKDKKVGCPASRVR